MPLGLPIYTHIKIYQCCCYVVLISLFSICVFMHVWLSICVMTVFLLYLPHLMSVSFVSFLGFIFLIGPKVVLKGTV